MSADKTLHIFFHIQHLLGIGHLQRASAIVRACVNDGIKVTIASGGETVSGVDLSGANVVQLPPVKSVDSGFSGLADSSGKLIDEAFKARRKKILLNAFVEHNADILLIENYPFGRRQLRWELIPLLETAAAKKSEVLVVSSIRDILQQRSQKREEETVELIDRYFNAVFVHGDPHFIPLNDSFSLTGRIREKIVYTGLVARDSNLAGTLPNPGTGEVLVSAGGGAVGYRLMRLALDARRSGFLADSVWRFLIGSNMPSDEARRLREKAPELCYFEPARTDFPALLRNCRLSISQAGYNTVMDIIQAQCPALLMPFEQGGETEQAMRAKKLASIGRCVYLPENRLTVENFIRKCKEAERLQTSMPMRINDKGAVNTAELLRRHWLALKRGD